MQRLCNQRKYSTWCETMQTGKSLRWGHSHVRCTLSAQHAHYPGRSTAYCLYHAARTGELIARALPPESAHGVPMRSAPVSREGDVNHADERVLVVDGQVAERSRSSGAGTHLCTEVRRGWPRSLWWQRSCSRRGLHALRRPLMAGGAAPRLPTVSALARRRQSCTTRETPARAVHPLPLSALVAPNRRRRRS